MAAGCLPLAAFLAEIERCLLLASGGHSLALHNRLPVNSDQTKAGNLPLTTPDGLLRAATVNLATGRFKPEAAIFLSAAREDNTGAREEQL